MILQKASPSTTGLVELTNGLFATAGQELSFAPEMVVRSFLIAGDGNVLINASEGALESAEAIDKLGGVDALWLEQIHLNRSRIRMRRSSFDMRPV